MMLGGLVIAVSGVLTGPLRVMLFFASIAGMIVPPIVYSWWFWQRKRSHEAKG